MNSDGLAVIAFILKFILYTVEDDVKATLSLNTSIAKFKEASPAFPVLTNW